MASDDRNRWREISRYLDEALDLAGSEREIWLRELDERAPAVSQAVRSLLLDTQHGPGKRLFLDAERRIARLRAELAQQLGAYTLESIIEHGGMGTVWLARRSDGPYESPAAVKLLNREPFGRAGKERLVREAAVLAKLRHPNIAQLIDAGVAPGGQPYLVLEYVEGERIDSHAERRNLDIEARIRLFLDVLAAVAHAHGHLIVHGDIKPSNILVTPGGAAKLLDFGVAACVGTGDGEPELEIEPGLTPGYAAPEQLLMQPVTTATDVYALGVVLFLLLARRHPLDEQGLSPRELACATLERDPPRPSELAASAVLTRQIRGDLDSIVAKALRRNPAERYRTAEMLAEELRAWLSSRTRPVLRFQ
jgi:eukaryotic-like serine/threonine-protein kinase